jgi:site-specific DNA recombinase
MLRGWYSDDAVSGRKHSLSKRPDGARLLVDAKERVNDSVIVYRVDRLGRGRKLLASLDELEEAGVRYIISVTETCYDLRNSNDEFHLTMLSGVSGYEASGFLQRSKDATNRLAREGVWLGGIVPYGYHVDGEDRGARLVVSDESMAGCGLSEADVIRLIYRRSTEDNWSCLRIADELNAMGVPPAYHRDGRTVMRGKRSTFTQGIWRPGRINSMLTNTTYKGLHIYGKHSEDPDREKIERAVPAIVDTETWERAQASLRARMFLSSRNGKRDFLVRGLVICGLCGLHYVGVHWDQSNGQKKAYYHCSAANQPRAIFGTNDKRCPSKAVNAAWLEKVVWTDIETFLRDPGDVLAQLAETMKIRESRVDELRDKLAGLKLRRGSKQAERDTVVGLYRRGRIDDATLERQLDQIADEESEHLLMLAELEAVLTNSQQAGEELRLAETLLQDLRTGLDTSPDTSLDFSVRRRIVETLVKRVTVTTFTDEHSKKQATIEVRYRFDGRTSPTITYCTGTDFSKLPA